MAKYENRIVSKNHSKPLILKKSMLYYKEIGHINNFRLINQVSKTQKHIELRKLY